jgi:hypothetical protein
MGPFERPSQRRVDRVVEVVTGRAMPRGTSDIFGFGEAMARKVYGDGIHAESVIWPIADYHRRLHGAALGNAEWLVHVRPLTARELAGEG